MILQRERESLQWQTYKRELLLNSADKTEKVIYKLVKTQWRNN